MGCSSSSSSAPKAITVHAVYEFQKKLGQGSFGQVRVCVQRSSGLVFAVKILDLQPQMGTQKNKRMDAAASEAAIWEKIGQHDHVVGLIETFNDGRFMYFIMEKCEYSVLDMLSNKGDGIVEADYFQTWYSILLALEFLHSKRIVHRDVKPANFLVDSQEKVKICDFGLSAVEPLDGLTGTVGTVPFMAPEIVQGRTYTRKVDIWSVGAMSFLMLYGHYPYLPHQDKEDRQKAKEEAERNGGEEKPLSKGDILRKVIAKGQPPPNFVTVNGLPEPSPLARSFVEALLVRTEAQRPTVEGCLQQQAILEVTSKSAPDIAHVPSLQWESAGTANSLAQVMKIVQQENAQLKTVVNPITAKTMDEILEKLQQEYGDGDWRRSFSAPSSAAPSRNPSRCSHEKSDSTPRVSGEASRALSGALSASRRHNSDSVVSGSRSLGARSFLATNNGAVSSQGQNQPAEDDGENSTTASSESRRNDSTTIAL